MATDIVLVTGRVQAMKSGTATSASGQDVLSCRDDRDSRSLLTLLRLIFVSPREAQSFLTWRSAIVVVVGFLAIEAVAFGVVMWLQPPFVVSEVIATSTDDTAALSDRLSDFVWNRTRMTVASRYRIACRDFLVLLPFWSLVGVLVGARGQVLRGTFIALAMGSAIWSVGFICRVILSFVANRDVGEFSLAFLAPNSPVGQTLGLFPAFTIWWAAVVGAGLAETWRSSTMFGVMLVLTTTFVWLCFPDFWHAVVGRLTH